jgi:hypothetical protein
VGINWLGLVKSGITGGISSAISGTLSNVACYGLAWGLDSIFGLQIGKPGTQMKIQDLTDALNNVDSELTAMSTQLNDIITAIGDLNAEINTTYHMTTNVVLGATFDSCIAAVQASWGTLQDDVAAFAAGSAPAPTPTPATTPTPTPVPNVAETLASQILASNTTGMLYQIKLMTQMLLPLSPGGTLGSNGLLDNWTTMLIGNVRQGLPIQKAYGVLEQNFLQVLQYLYQAHSLMLNAYMYRGAQFSLSNVPGNMQAAQSEAQAAGFSYLSQTAEPNLKEVSQFFVQCAHRLVLSQYMCLNADGSDFVPVKQTDIKDVEEVLARVALIDILVNSQGGAKAPVDPGVVVTGYYRPSQIANGAGPSLTPSAAYTAKAGTLLPIKYGYAEVWYKVCDFTDPAFSTLRDFADSNIQIADAVWPTPVPAIGQPVGTGVFAQAIGQYYDTTTLDVTSAGPNAVVMAFALDWSSIYDNSYCSATKQFLPYFNSNPNTGGEGLQAQPGTISFATNPQGEFESAAVWVSDFVSGQYKYGPVTVTTGMMRAMTYGGTTAATLYFRTNWTLEQMLTSQVSNTTTEKPLPWSITQQTAVGNPASPQVLKTIDATVPTPWKYGQSTTPQNSSGKGIVGACEVAASGNCTLGFMLIFWAGKQSAGTEYGANQMAQLYSTLTVLPGTTIAWQQPQTGLTIST